MRRTAVPSAYTLRKVSPADIAQVYELLTANRPYVGLNSRYTYFLLAKDFNDTCLVALVDGKIVGFSSGYVPPNRPDTFFSWEVVVHKDYRGNGLQKSLMLNQINQSGVRFFEGTVNPSNEVSKRNICELAKMLKAECRSNVLFTEEDFGNDGHEAEVLLRIGPICRASLKRLLCIDPTVFSMPS